MLNYRIASDPNIKPIQSGDLALAEPRAIPVGPTRIQKRMNQIEHPAGIRRVAIILIEVVQPKIEPSRIRVTPQVNLVTQLDELAILARSQTIIAGKQIAMEGHPKRP